jgi:lipid A 3-O-deacylase
MRLYSTTLAAVIVAALLVTSAARADAQHGSLSLLVENDLFYNTDRDYTSGVQLNDTTAPLDTHDGLADLSHWLLNDEGNARAGFELGQDIFTPSNTLAVNPPTNQRPYAGYLYTGLSLLVDTKTRYDQLEVQLGVVGPAALGRDAQAFVHSIEGIRKPAGWHFQLRDEPTLEITYQRSYKIIDPDSTLGNYFDLEPHFGAAVGNIYDYVNAGALARLGFNLNDDFGAPLRMEPALPGSSFTIADDFAAYIFAGIDGRALARNIFLDGNSFERSRSVPKLPFVVDFQLGAAADFDGFRISFTHVFRTREYHGQPSSDQFGAVNLTFRN